MAGYLGFRRVFAQGGDEQLAPKHRVVKGKLNSSMVKSDFFHMKIAIAADHAGFALKETLRRKLADEGHEVLDLGPNSAESCDYPDFAQAVGREVSAARSDRGILVCSTGIGMAIAANKIEGVRA